jgi:hypothetical protein
MTGPFATATEFCAFTGVRMPEDPARLQSLLDKASAEIRGFTGQTLSRVTDEQIFFPSWSGALIVLPERPVIEVASVVTGGVPIASSAYAFTRGGNLWRLDGSYWGAAAVTYTHGYAEADEAFHRIASICIQIASRAYTLNERSASEALGSTLMESAGYSPEIFLTPGEQERLSAYGAGVMA